jgi:periplasmic protein TonB
MKRRISPEIVAAVVSSIALHAVWLARDARASYGPEAKPAEVLLEAETVVPPVPPPVEEPKPELEKEAPAVVNTAPRGPSAANATSTQAPAQAAKTLTAPDAADPKASVADFTMVQGDALSYAGGTTSATGTSATAVRGPASDKPVAALHAPIATVAIEGPDRSRGARPTDADWNCSRLFPNDPEAGDRAAVLIAVTVLPSGAPSSVAVLRDPGHGFGAAARACAMAQRYSPAFDRGGSPIAATTPPITVRFTR